MRKFLQKREDPKLNSKEKALDDSPYELRTNFKRIIFATIVVSLIFSFYHMVITRYDVQFMTDQEVLNEQNLFIMRLVLIASLMTGLSCLFQFQVNSSVRIVTNLVFFLILSLFITLAFDILNNTNFIFALGDDGLGKLRTFWSVLICLAIFYLLYALIGRAKISAYVGVTFFLFFGIISHMILIGRGERFLFADIMGVGTALEVVGGYTIVYTYEFDIFLILLFTCFFICSNLSSTKEKWTARLADFVISAVIAVMFLAVPASKYYYSWTDTENSYIYHFTVNASLLNLKKPDDYSAEEVEKIIEQGKGASILKQIDASYDPQQAMREAFPFYQMDSDMIQPNVIAIMNESLTDLTEYGDFETTLPVLENYNSIRQNVISGNLYVDVFGGGTADSEYTFFTGNSLYFVPSSARPYQLYLTANTPSIISTLMSQGYSSSAIHPASAANWNRNNAYPNLGIEEFYDIASFSNLSDVQFVRNFVSDETTYQLIEELYENKIELEYSDSELVQPLFIFDLTMQNHGGYLTDNMDIELVQIQGKEGKYPQTEEYLSSVRQSDLAFANLIEYFSTVDEPTIICMFGDHQPNIGDDFSSSLQSDNLSSLEQSQLRQTTPFIIWANFELPAVDIDRMSTNYLSTLLLECTGLETTAYNQYLAWLYKQLPVINRTGYIDSEGNYFNGKDIPDDMQELIEDYHIVDYNNMIDPDSRVEDLYRVDGTS